jgi:hypothetical protein
MIAIFETDIRRVDLCSGRHRATEHIAARLSAEEAGLDECMPQPNAA